MPPLHTQYPVRATREHPHSSVRSTVTGLSPSLVRRSRRLRVHRRGSNGVHTPHLFCSHKRFGLPCAAFFRQYSRHRNCFLFLRVLRCFSSPRSRSHAGSSRVYRDRKSHWAISGSKAPCAYPEHIAAWHDLPRCLSQAIPQMTLQLFSVQVAYA